MYRAVTASLLLAILLAARPEDPGVDAELAAAVQAAADAYFAEHFPDEAHRLDVRVERVSPDLSGAGPFTVSFTAPKLPRGKVQAGLHSGAQKVGWALLYVAHFDTVATVLSRIERGAEVGSSDVAFSRLETTRLPGEPLRASDFRGLSAAGPLQATRLLREGQALRLSDVRGAYAAETGGPVLVHYDRRGVRLKLSCTARESGAAGEVIRAYHQNTDTMYRVRLTGPGTAVWLATLNTASNR